MRSRLNLSRNSRLWWRCVMCQPDAPWELVTMSSWHMLPPWSARMEGKTQVLSQNVSPKCVRFCPASEVYAGPTHSPQSRWTWRLENLSKPSRPPAPSFSASSLSTLMVYRLGGACFRIHGCCLKGQNDRREICDLFGELAASSFRFFHELYLVLIILIRV